MAQLTADDRRNIRAIARDRLGIERRMIEINDRLEEIKEEREALRAELEQLRATRETLTNSALAEKFDVSHGTIHYHINRRPQ